MKTTIVCYVGDYAICKNENGDVTNISKKKVQGFKEGETINIDEKGNVIKEKKKEKYYICDDIIIFYDDEWD